MSRGSLAGLRRRRIPLEALARPSEKGPYIRKEDAMRQVAKALGMKERAASSSSVARAEKERRERRERRERSAKESSEKNVIKKEMASLKKGMRHLQKKGEKQSNEFKDQLAQKDRQISILLSSLQQQQQHTHQMFHGQGLQQQPGGGAMPNPFAGFGAPPIPQQQVQQPMAIGSEGGLAWGDATAQAAAAVAAAANVPLGGQASSGGGAADKRQCVVNVRKKDGSRAAQFKLGFKGQTSPDSLRKTVAQHMQLDPSRFTWIRGAEGESNGELTLMVT